MTDQPITLIGAGLAGTLLSILLARRGHRVRVYERLPDQRREAIPAGRSINLALAARGIAALELADVMPQILPLLIPMPGRLLHLPDGSQSFVPYGQREHEVIYSVSRPGLNRILLDAAEAAGVELHFRQSSVDANLHSQQVLMRDESSGNPWELPMQRVIAADGAGSPLRRALAHGLETQFTEDLLEHSYKELTLPADSFGNHRIHKNALHIWPRGGFMLIALPNLDGSFTVTLFLPQTGPESFATLTNEIAIDEFFHRHFPDAAVLMPQLAREFLAHPTGIMGTVRCERWSFEDRLLLIGDAAHAILPFHGQGMNCAFEDCRELDRLLQQHTDWSQAFSAFDRTRHPDTDAIADMAFENYEEMRDTVRHPKFQLQKILSLELERRFPDRFVPRYSMVMFHDDIPYAVAFERGRIQQDILNQLTGSAATLDQVDFDLATQLIERRLPPIAGIRSDA
ncbi:MAG TPA: NAD(P)/FAD-dependent oxidoreductase [Povalibacter sp.]|uniref:FAD-dependent oxidoreductase n=1 Tax=Povalibacter sp. TaxID=1962978 RepID=UPI002CE5D8CD|nr:NAD(P)/FAD-dependent oxidoreductase [Povalibacter sp.]HMN44487.1 NAD(P)/FAD-dependent oxidoreductase [Povalibacter sp.]